MSVRRNSFHAARRPSSYRYMETFWRAGHQPPALFSPADTAATDRLLTAVDRWAGWSRRAQTDVVLDDSRRTIVLRTSMRRQTAAAANALRRLTAYFAAAAAGR